MSQEQVHRWWRAAVDDLGEEPPPDDAVEAVRLTYVDRVLANAQATGLLERVTCRTDGPVILRGDEGEEYELAPGKPLVLVDRGGRAYRLLVED
ncbi:MAG: hypothetical protein M3R02_18250 [Chloroflexota bacterium]|nr:hypothetical protein [Chloroflexota bacterium]HSH60236.1 hypothetical protein [Acidimicrobiales bacterium]